MEMIKLADYATAEEKAEIAEHQKALQKIQDVVMCRFLTQKLGKAIEYVDEHHITVDGVSMDETQFDEYVQSLKQENAPTEA